MAVSVRIGGTEVPARVDFSGDVAFIEVVPDEAGRAFLGAAVPGLTVRVIFGDERDHDFAVSEVDRVRGSVSAVALLCRARR